MYEYVYLYIIVFIHQSSLGMYYTAYLIRVVLFVEDGSHVITSEGCIELLTVSGSADSADSNSRDVPKSCDHI